ncbi:hypothetical protein [Streptomyces sp. NPDC001401]|uniref:hypothetical protein n=1 Tax=Streptomyces sp. NPDC001401 TaxID=3364570 RepID=UPI003680142D
MAAARAVTVGRYTFTPAAAYSAAEACGTLHGDGARIELQVTGAVFTEFLRTLDTAQEELGRRWNDQGRSGCHAGT